jgi:uncharacterized membrane protein (DUF106 family)
MEHPLINNVDDLTMEELQAKMTELTKKVGIAYRMGNAQLVSQIRMALETYTNKYQEKQQELYNAAKKGGPDFSDKIDIS